MDECHEDLPFHLELPSHLIDDLLKKSTRTRHVPRTVLLRPQDVPEALHLVSQGEVEIREGIAGICSRVSGQWYEGQFSKQCFGWRFDGIGQGIQLNLIDEVYEIESPTRTKPKPRPSRPSSIT